MALSEASLRINSGRFRGRQVGVPAGIRPTSGRVRSAVMNIWQIPITGATFLDLFAGSGAVGLEALSRGAERVVFVEDDPLVLRNLETVVGEFSANAISIVAAHLPEQIQRLDRAPVLPFDLVFADPPYDFGDYDDLISAVAPYLTPNGEVAIEHRSDLDLPHECGAFSKRDCRNYGDSAITRYIQRFE